MLQSIWYYAPPIGTLDISNDYKNAKGVNYIKWTYCRPFTAPSPCVSSGLLRGSLLGLFDVLKALIIGITTVGNLSDDKYTKARGRKARSKNSTARRVLERIMTSNGTDWMEDRPRRYPLRPLLAAPNSFKFFIRRPQNRS